MTKFKDLSVTMKNFCMEPSEVKITYVSHAEVQRREAKMAGLPTDLIMRFGATDYVRALSHAGTHVDASWHFGPMVAGKPAKTIDQLPLEWCYGNGVLLDFSKIKKPEEAILIEDIKRELNRIDYVVSPMDIVLIRTGAEDCYDYDPRYAEMGSGLVKQSLMWLLDQGVKLIGTDAYTLDIPIPKMVEELKKGNKEAFFPVHLTGREREYIHAEKLFNLKSLEKPFGFKVAMFPIKIGGGSAGWTRAVAIEGEGVLAKEPNLIDLSVPLINDSMDREECRIDRISHEDGARRLAKRFGINRKFFPTPDTLFANDEVYCSTHAGTHLNAPWHYDGEVVEGKSAKTIDEVPLEQCYGNGVLLDLSHKGANERITVTDLMKELSRIGYELKPGDIVLIRTGAEDHFFNNPDFGALATGLSSDALLWLFSKGITIIGTDSSTMDISLEIMSQKLTNGNNVAYLGHKGEIIRESGWVENLYNLKKLPRPYGFKVAIFPINLFKCSASWTRAVAIL